MIETIALPKEVESFPRVTDIIGIVKSEIDFLKQIKPDMISAKAELGTTVNDIIDKIILGQAYDLADFSDEIQARVLAWIVWSAENVDEYLFVQSPVWSLKYKYKGTLDAVAKLKSGKIALIDWKCTAQISRQSALQLSAYELALNETYGIKVDERLIVQLNTDKAKQTKQEKKIELFLYSRELYKYYKGE